jgi:hypothetical protein
MIVLAVVAGIATWLVLSALWAFLVGLMRGAAGQWGALAGLEPWKTAVLVPGWFGATWAGWSVFEALA